MHEALESCGSVTEAKRHSVTLKETHTAQGESCELFTQDTVEIPYTPVRTTFVEITSFRPSFLDPSSPGLTLTPMKCVQNKKLMIYRLV